MSKTRPRRAFGLNIIVSISLLLATEPLRSQETTETDTDLVYQEALNSELYGEAEVAAKELIERTISTGRRDDLSMAELLGKLALAQRLNSDFESALQNYELAVDIIESSKDMLDIALTESLLGLGLTYIESERPGLALAHLDRALHVHHVNAGPHSLEQTTTLEALAVAYLQLGNSRDAKDIADRLFLLYVRTYPSQSMELVPALLKKGQIYGHAGSRREERKAYNAAVKIVQHNDGKSSSALVRPLIHLGDSHKSEYFELLTKVESEEELPDARLLIKASSFYKAALELARQETVVDWQLKNEALLALGDFYMMTEEYSRARVLYRDVWRLLSEDEARLRKRDESLGGVVTLFQVVPNLTVALPFGADREKSVSAYGTGNIVISLTVTRRGRPTNIRLVEIAPERSPEIESEVKRALSRFVYRPRFEGGFPVDTPGRIIRYEFPYPKMPSGEQ